MKVKTQLFVDRYIAKPVAYLLNFLVRLVGQLLSIEHSLDRDFERIAVCKFKGMGSILQSTPMLHAIKRRFPAAELIYVSTQGNRQILEQIDWVDTVVTVDDRSLWAFVRTNLQAIWLLMRKRPQVYFDLEIYADYSTLFTLFTLSVNRVGFYLRSSSFRMGIYTHMMFFNPRVPISQVYLQLAKLIGCDTEGAQLYPLRGQEALPFPADTPYLVINPNASDLRLERRWGKARFAALITHILEAVEDLNIVLVGSKGEYAYTQSVAEEVGHPRVINTAGQTSLNGLISIIDQATAMVSNDTGPMHVAFCTNTPVICLFGPCSPQQYGTSPYAHIMYKPVFCSPCVHDFEVPPCKGDNVCMQLITVEEVVQQTLAVLAEPGKVADSPQPAFVYTVGEKVLGKVYRG